MTFKQCFLFFVLLPSIVGCVSTDTSKKSGAVARIAAGYYVTANVPYIGTADRTATLDVFVPRSASPGNPVPTVIFFHGGGWMGGDKSVVVLHLLPYLDIGWAAVNVNYTAGEGTAPKAVFDCHCALAWVRNNASKFHFDTRKLIVSGESAGAHLALAAGMKLMEDANDRCDINSDLSVAAIVNWYGILDVESLLDDEQAMSFGRDWFNNVSDRGKIAHSISPKVNVGSEVPPIFSVYGEKDRIVLSKDAVEFHSALSRSGVNNQLFTVSKGGHGGFTSEDIAEVHRMLIPFLERNVLKK